MRNPHSAIACLLLALAATGRAAEPAARLDVLRAEASGTILDVLLRVVLPGEQGQELAPRDIAAFIAPAGVPVAEAAVPRFRLPRLFLKRLDDAYYIDLRQLPAGVGASACQLVLRIRRGGHRLATHRLPRLLEPPAEALDVALLIDQSLSMRRTDPEKLRIDAAKTFVDLARRSTRIARIAIVGFDTKARTLAPLTSPTQPDTLYRAIERVRAIGQTDMDAALHEARAVFDQSSSAAKAVVLLTDGKDEPGRYENAHRHFVGRRWRVYTVGLSKRADTAVLQRIARDTGGEYHEAPTNAELQDIFGKICLALQRKVPIRSRTFALRAAHLAADPFPVDDSISALTVSLKARDPDLLFTLLDPAARLLAPDRLKTTRRVSYDRKAAYQHYNLWSPPPGQWTTQLKAPRPGSATVSATAVTPLLLRAFPLKPTCYRGEPVELAASLAIGDSVLAHARVEARLTTADGKSTTLPLHDDGKHHDTDPDDGVFAGLFPGSEAPGPCTIRLVAAGTTPAGHRFERELDHTTRISSEGHSKLWCSARSLDFGVLYSGETASRSLQLKLTSALDTALTEAIRTALPPLATADARFPTDSLRLSPSPLRLATGRLATVRLDLAVPPQQPPGRYRTRLTLTSKYDERSIAIQAEVRRPTLVLDKRRVELGAVESGTKAEATLSLRLDPRGTLAARVAVSDPRFALAPARAVVGQRPVLLRITFAPPAGLASASLQAKLTIQSVLGTSEVPVTAKVVRPTFAASPAAIDFGELRPGQAAARPLTLRLDGLAPRQAAVAAPPLPGPAGAAPLKLTAPDTTLQLKPGTDAVATLRLAVPPAQPPGTYRGSVAARTPLGERAVAVTARVAAIDTIRVGPVLDFGQVAVGGAAERAVELESLVDAEQKIQLALPPPSPGWRLAAEPGSLIVGPRAKARVTLRLVASATARPGPRHDTIRLLGPSRARTLTARVEFFRPPHQSLAFEPPRLDLRRLQAGVAERLAVTVRSLVDEPQKVAIGAIQSPAHVVRIVAAPTEWTLPAGGTGRLTLSLQPLAGDADAPFEATVVVRGRSLPATLRLRGLVFTPPGATFTVEPAVLDFGALPPGARATAPVIVESRHPRQQKLSFGQAPLSDGVALAVSTGGLHLPPGVAQELAIDLHVSSDAPLGARHLTWEVRGPGEPATFEARVEVVAPDVPPTVAGSEPTGIGWAEGVALFLLLALLLAVLVAAYLLARWLIRAQRMPRMAKYFALSALVHAAVLFTALDLLVARKIKEEKLVPTFKVGLKAVAGSLFSGREASPADTLRRRHERERRLDADHRRRQAQQVARALLEVERRQLDPAQARLDRPKPQEKPRLDLPDTQTRKHTAQEVAELLEEIREREKIRQPAQPRPQAPAETRAARIARVRAMSRAELAAAVRNALKPSAAKAARRPEPAAQPPVPALAGTSRGRKAAAALDDLVPALEDLKQQLAAQGTQDQGTLAAQQVGPSRTARGAAIDRGTAAAARPAAAQARGMAASARPGTQRAAAASPLLAAGPSRPPAAKAPAPSFEPPVHDVAPSEGAAAAAAQPGATGAGIAAQDVGTVRAARRAAIGRRSTGGSRRPDVQARGHTAASRRSTARTGLLAAFTPTEAPATHRHSAPPGFAAPDETPTTDALVSLPTAPAGRTVDAKPLVVRHQPGSGSVPSARPAIAAAAAAAAPRAAPATERAPAGRAGTTPRLPGASAAPAAAKATPSLDDFVLVEGPLVAPRQAAPSAGEGLGARTVVARWQLRRRADARAGLAAAGAPTQGSLAPRALAAGRPTAGLAMPALDLGAPTQPRLAPAWDGAPDEQPHTRPGLAQARPRGEAATAVATTHAAGTARIERQDRAPGSAAPLAIGPRDSRAASARPTGQPLPAASGELGAAQARRDTPPLDVGLPEESVEPAPRLAARSGRGGPGVRDVAPAAIARGSRELAPSPRRSTPQALAPRTAALTRTRPQHASRLLLPGLSRATPGAGSVVGTQTGGVTRFILTTVRYGSGEVDWDTHKTAMPFLAWQLREQVGFNVETRIAEVPLESPKIMRSPWIFMSGHKDFRFTRAQVANLRRYLLGGGTLWADDSTHEDDFTWDKAFRRELVRVLPPQHGYRLRKITKPDDHPIFRSCFDLSQGYEGYFPPPGDKYRQDHIEGLDINGRLAVIYTRNDYGDGLEIKPDTFPLKASLSGLSPAQMQQASFLMASNIIVYVLTGGRGLRKPGLVARAAESLRRRHEARHAGRDPYADAPATLFDDFGDAHWDIEDEWEGAGPAGLVYGRRGDPEATGRRLAVSYRLGRDDAKVVLLRDLPEELDLSAQDRIYIDIESRLAGGARLTVALITMPDWKYFESRPAFLKPGANRVHVDLRAATWKTGERVDERQSEFSRRIANPQAVRRLAILLYPVGRRGTVVLDRIEFRAKPRD